MKSISEFIDSVELPPGMPSLVEWDKILREGGYYMVPVTSYNHWQQVIAWCNEMFGEDHYTWTGYSMWFETSEAATLFALRWR